MCGRHPRLTRTDTLFAHAALFRSGLLPLAFAVEGHIEGVERAAGADRGALQGHAVPAQSRRRDVDAARLAEAGVLALYGYCHATRRERRRAGARRPAQGMQHGRTREECPRAPPLTLSPTNAN